LLLEPNKIKAGVWWRIPENDFRFFCSHPKGIWIKGCNNIAADLKFFGNWLNIEDLSSNQI
jgi:hypothetical protein